MPVKWLELEEVMTNCGPLISLMWPLYGKFFSCELWWIWKFHDLCHCHRTWPLINMIFI